MQGEHFINRYRKAEDYFFRGIAVKCLDLDDGAAHAYMTDVPVADLNLVYITRNTNALGNILRQCEHFFSQRNLSFVVIIPQEFCEPETEGILSSMGYLKAYGSVSMAMKLDDFVTNSPATFDEAVIAANDSKLNEWMMPLIGAFESTLEISSVYAKAHENALNRNVNLRHFSLYKQDAPIASITLSIHGHIARIDDVGTLPEFQGKGYATHIMSCVLAEAKKSGAQYCFLEASESGLRLYQKLGFEPLFKNSIYSKKV